MTLSSSRQHRFGSTIHHPSLVHALSIWLPLRSPSVANSRLGERGEIVPSRSHLDRHLSSFFLYTFVPRSSLSSFARRSDSLSVEARPRRRSCSFPLLSRVFAHMEGITFSGDVLPWYHGQPDADVQDGTPNCRHADAVVARCRRGNRITCTAWCVTDRGDSVLRLPGSRCRLDDAGYVHEVRRKICECVVVAWISYFVFVDDFRSKFVKIDLLRISCDTAWLCFSFRRLCVCCVNKYVY